MTKSLSSELKLAVGACEHNGGSMSVGIAALQHWYEAARMIEGQVESLQAFESRCIDKMEILRQERDYADNAAVERVQATIGNLRGRIARMLAIAGKYAHPGVNLGAHALAWEIIKAGKEC